MAVKKIVDQVRIVCVSVPGKKAVFVFLPDWLEVSVTELGKRELEVWVSGKVSTVKGLFLRGKVKAAIDRFVWEHYREAVLDGCTEDIELYYIVEI